MKAHATLTIVFLTLAAPSFSEVGENSNGPDSVPMLATNVFMDWAALGPGPGLEETLALPGAGRASSPLAPTPEALLAASNGVASVSAPATNVVVYSKSSGLLPGVYQAMPYSCFVVVPRPLDEGMVHAPASTNQFAILSVEPPLHLEPKR